MKRIILSLALILLLPTVYSQSITIEGGNITEVNLTAKIISPNWQGFAGQAVFSLAPTSPGNFSATGSYVNGTDVYFQIDCDSP